MHEIEMFDGSQVMSETDGTILSDVSHADLISHDFVEKTSEQIWGELSVSGQTVAQALSMSPSSMRKETIEYMLAPERETDSGRDLDVTAGLNELRQAGVLKERTLLDHWDTVVVNYQHHDEKGSPATIEKKFAEYRRSVFYLAQYTDNPGAYPELQEPEYALTSDFKDFLIPPSQH